MSEQHTRILTMLSEGKITVEQAESLLAAVDEHANIERSAPVTDQKFLYVEVEPKEGKASERVSVKIPFALLKAGLNIAGLIPADARTKIEQSMHEKGLSFDLNQLNSENLEELLTALELLKVDVDSDDATIQVFCR